MSDKMKVHYMSKTNEWATPQKLFDYLNEIHNFNLDPCATDENHKCDTYFTIKDDGLSQSWVGYNVFVNPPYGRGIRHWTKKAYNESLKDNTKVVMLIPARTDTTYWHDFIFDKAHVTFIKGRVRFGDGKAPASFPSAIITFDGTVGFDTVDIKEIMSKELKLNL